MTPGTCNRFLTYRDDMTTSLLARRAVPAVAGAAAVLLLAACGSGGSEASDAGAGSTSASSAGAEPTGSSAAPTDEGAADEALAAGLLPAEGFGPGATVTPVSAEELQAQEQQQAGSLEGVTVTPEACAAAVQSTQTKTDAYDAIAAQVATTDASTATVQLLTEGGPVDGAIGTARDNVASCSEATISSPEIGTATITFAPLELPDLGDDSTGLLYTTTVTGADGSVVSVPIVLALVQDGQRMLTLITTGSPDQPVDQAAFVTLLEAAYQHQADTLD